MRRGERRLLETLTPRLPEPIADAAAAFYAEARASNPDWFRAFHRLIDAFEVSVAFAALVAALGYVRSGARAAPATQAVEALRDQAKLSTGFWWHLLRECLRPFEGAREALFIPELYDVYFRRDGRIQPGARLLDAVPGLRNRLKGHAFTLPPGRYQSVVAEQAPVLEELLVSLEGLAAYPLVRVLAVETERDGGGATATVELRVGSSFRCGRFSLRLDGAPDVGEMLLLGPETEHGRSFLSLHPFVVHRTLDAEIDLGEVGLFQGRGGQSVEFLAVRSGGRFALDGLGDGVLHALSATRAPADPTRALRSEDGRLVVGDVIDAAAAGTDAYLTRARKDRVYLPEAFTDRRRVRALVDGFFEGDRHVALLAGAAGAGKTSMMCRLAEDLRLANPSAPVLLVPANSLPTSREPMRDALGRLFALPEGFTRGLARYRALPWPRSPSRLHLLVDGLDRSDDPPAVLAALLACVRDEPDVRVVISVAAAVLEGIVASGALADVPGLFRTDEGLCDGHAILVPPLEPDEVEAAYDRYRSLEGSSPLTPFTDLSPLLRAALANPLLLRIACEVYHRKEIGAEVTEVDVLVEHARRTAFADAARQDFVKRLVRRLAAGQRRRLPLRELLDDAFARSAILSPDGAYHALLVDQVVVEVQGRSAGLGLAPETFVEFAFDATLGYLLLLERLEREDADLAQVIAELATAAPTFAPAAVALDIALRATPSRDRMELTLRILESAPGPLGSEVVARFLDWLDAPARASLVPVVHAILAGQEHRADDDFRALLVALEEVFGAPPPMAAGGPSSTFVDELLGSGRLGSDRALELAVALHRRHANELAGFLAHRTLERAYDELPGVRRREAELVLADVLRRVGSDEALRAAEHVARGTAESARGARNEAHLRRALMLLVTLDEHLEEPHRRILAAEELLALSRNDDPDRLAALVRVARAYLAVGRRADAVALRGGIVELSERYPNTREAGEAFAHLRADAEPAARESLHARAVARFQAVGDLERESIEHRDWAWERMELGRVEEAERLARHALALARTAGASGAEQACYGVLAKIAERKGETAAARALFVRTGRAALALGSISRLHHAVRNHLVFLYNSGDFGECRRLWHFTDELLERRARSGLDLRVERRANLANEAELTMLLGDPARAEHLARASTEVDRELGRPIPYPYARLAVAIARQGRAEEALVHARHARELALASPQRHPRVETAAALAECLSRAGRNEEAITTLRAEIEAADASGSPGDAARLRVHLAEVLLATGALPEALAEAEAADSLYAKAESFEERYRCAFVLSRIFEATAKVEPKRAVRLRERAKHLLGRAASELAGTVAKFAGSPYRLDFLRKNPLARAIREATEDAVVDDAEAEGLDAPD